MNCPSCAHENRPGAKFCEACAAPLNRVCASCGAELRPTAKFCDECATPIAGAAPAPRLAEPAGARKIVTIVFADLVGSTALHERLDPESARRFMESYYAAMRGAVESHGGTVTQLLGDGVKAVFGIPRVAEDDAIRAVRAAAEMQRAFRELAEQQRGAVGATGLRVAVNTGEVVANDASEIIGDPVNVAARLQEQGRDGDVVVGDATARLVATLVTLAPLGSFTLKGRAEAVRAFRLESLDRPEGATTAAFVGRDDEITRITVVYETAVEKPATGLAVLLGSPGLGKSRLIDEFAQRLGDTATVVAAHCDATGGATFAPLADALRELLRVDAGASGDALHAAIESALAGDDAERARIVGGIGLLLAGSPASPEETFFVVRRLFAALATRRPVVLVIDDLHWAEPLLLDLVEHLVQWGSGVPLLVLVGARPELRDMRSSLVTPGGLVADVVTLAGLDAGAAMRLAANVIGAADLPAAVAAKVLATSEGNPLFVGELVRMLVHEGALKREGDRWTTGTALAALEMPPTIHALLAARIGRLRSEERTVLERASVVGRHFSRSAVAELLPRDVADLDARLESLRRSELIERDTGWFLGEPVLRFHHVLIRDAAYRQLLKGTRAELHERFADWVLSKAGDAVEHDETIGWHLERAHQHLRELGPIEAKGRELGERASKHLAAAGRRALARDDLPLAASLLGRALQRLDAEDPARADLALDWCEALLAAGDVGPASAAIDELGRFTADSDRLRAWHTCFAGQHLVLTAPSALHATAETVAAAAEELTRLGDAAGEAKAHFVYALALSRLGKVGACEAALDRALAAARRAGDRRRANTVLAIAPLAALWGPSPVTRASGRCLDVVRVLRITQGAPAVEAVALSCQGVLEALRGRTDAARRMIASARKMVEELGITQRLLEVDAFGGLVELLEGDAPAAERSLRGAYDGLRDLGLGIDAARAAALLARALLAQDRVDEAEALSHESEALAGDDLKAAIAWRGVRAEALARRGEHAAAVAFASKAVEIAAATDALLDHADARLALAAALRSAGRDREADAEERRATELWEAKGATLLAERTPLAAASAVPVAAAPAQRAAHAPRRRPVRPNFAFEEMRRAEAAVAARDARALESLYLRDVEVVDHQFGITYGHATIVERVRAIIEDSTESAFAHEPLATLGESLALCRLQSTASGSTADGISIGATEVPYLLVIEADEQGSARHIEIFGDDKLGDAIARLYERYADLLPEGPARACAAATARALGTMLSTPGDPDRSATIFTADFESVDHRHLSTWSLRGGAAFVEHLRALHAVAADVAIGVDDVPALGPSVLLVRRMHAGTERIGGGGYERPFLLLVGAGADGRLARAEWFDADREAEAFARFDALTTAPVQPRSVRRRVRPNGAARAIARFDAACAANDVDAAAAVHRADFEETDHPTGASYPLAGARDGLRRLLRAQDPHMVHEPLATLGESLLLARRSTGASASAGGRFDVGAWAREEVVVAEVDGSESLIATEIFGGDRLGDAVVRLYERYADQLPVGAARARAEATARSVAVVAPGGVDLDQYTAAFRADTEVVDQRLLGLGTASGPQTLFRSMAAGSEIFADQVASRPQDVLALTHDALLLRWLVSGVGRESGGAFEWAFLRLFVFDVEGRVARYELFDVDREGEALARFDELVGGGDAALREHPFANAASRADRRRTDCFNARDWAGVEACASPDLVFDERRRLLHNKADKQVWLEQTRLLFDLPDSRFTIELVATRGECLSLHLHEFEGNVAGGGGPLSVDPHLALHEVDRDGRIASIVLFDREEEDAAYAELDARFEADPGAAHGRVAVEFVRAIARRDWDAVAALCSPAFVEHDHRCLAVLGTTRGAEAWMQNFRTLVELAPDTLYRSIHVRTAARGFLSAGTWQGSREGGRYEIPLIAVLELNAGGAIARADIYEPDQQEQALARFAELDVVAPPAVPFSNAASRVEERMSDCWNARDWQGYARLHAPAFRFFDRRGLVQLELDRDRNLEFTRELGDMGSAQLDFQILATRGDRLVLSRVRIQVAGGDVGTSEVEHLNLLETDARGDLVAHIRFDADDVDAAYAEIDARFEAGEAALNPLAATWLAGYLGCFAARDWDAMRALFAPDLVGHNHRLVGWGTLHGPAALVSTLEAQVELAPDTQERIDHVRTCERGVLFEYAWHGTHEGCAFENVWLVLVELNDQGRARRADVWEAEQQAVARARFDALQAATRSPSRFANAATATSAPVIAALVAHDWAAFEALFAESFRCFDRRRMVQLEFDRAGYVAFTREVADGRSIRGESIALATRGERLALVRSTFVFTDGDVGPSEIAFLLVTEVDARGRIVAYVRFDDDDLAAARDELDARFAAGEGAAHPHALASLDASNAAIRRRDWDASAALCAPTFRMRDQRLLGWGTMVNDAATFVRVIRSAVELAPDSNYRVDHLRICARGILARVALCGTRDAGAFENPFLRVTEVDEQGRVLSHDTYDESDFERALARFAEIAASAAPEGRFENAASRAWRAAIEAWRSRDVARFEALQPRPLRYRDHRRLFQLDLDREEFLDFTRPLLTMRSAAASIELLATRGERLALMRFTLTMEDETVGPSAIDSLLLCETDECGDIAAYDRWDLEDEDAAWDEIEARWKTGEGAQSSNLLDAREFDVALERRDWDAAAACYAPDFVGHDHRLVSWGTLHGPTAFVRTLQEMVALAPDVRMRTNHRRAHGRGVIRDITWLGTRDGGAFESPFVAVTELGAAGRIIRADFYDPHHLDRALARFEEIRAGEPRDPLPASVKPNLATASVERSWIAFDAFDLDAANEALDAAHAHFAPGFVWEDRRPVVGLSGGLDLMLASARERLASGARHERRTIIGTAGDRIAIARVLWAGGPADGRFEVEFLVVHEVDEAGLCTALLFFDPDDTRAAQREAWSRWAAIDPAVAPWLDLLSEVTDAWNGRDRVALRARFADDVVVEDHRLTGIGRIEGAAAYVAANAVLWDLAPDQRIEFDSSLLGFDGHGLVATLRRVGTLTDGGAFESEYVWLSLARDGRVTHLELFEAEQRGAALARFEELRPDPLRIPRNAATRALDLVRRKRASGDAAALRSLVTDDFLLDDRTKRAQLRGGVEEWLSGLEYFRTEIRAQLESRLVATAGDRLALHHIVWRETPGESSFRIERFHLIEIDAAGKLRAFVIFDGDDRATAHTGLFERYVALGADGMPACSVEFARALAARDLGRVRAVLADDFVYHDRRRAGAGRLEGPDAYLASPRAWWELSEDGQIDMLHTVAVAPHGRVTVNRMAGRNLEGGDFESFMLVLLWTRGERVAGVEMFEVDQLDAALARLEALRPDPLRIPQTAATRMRDRHRDAFVARDWDAVRALTGADFVYHDRGKRALVRGNVEAWIASMEFTTQPGFRSESALIGTLSDRIVLDRLRWFGKPDGDAFEFERVRLLEVGADGLLQAVLFFDPEDRFAASVEGLARFAAGEAAGSAGIAPMLAFSRALCDRDWEAARDCYAPDVVLVDHRPLSFGTLDRDQWIAAMRATDDLSVGLAFDVVRVLAWNDRGCAVGIRRLGTIPDGGGAFENELFVVALVMDGRFQRYELVGEADAERAVARFAELCATPPAEETA